MDRLAIASLDLVSLDVTESILRCMYTLSFKCLNLFVFTTMRSKVDPARFFFATGDLALKGHKHCQVPTVFFVGLGGYKLKLSRVGF
jgi:hypothetical protein